MVANKAEHGRRRSSSIKRALEKPRTLPAIRSSLVVPIQRHARSNTPKHARVATTFKKAYFASRAA